MYCNMVGEPFPLPRFEQRTGGRLTLSVGEFKTKCKVVTRTPFKEDFAMLFHRWLECCIKCACIGGGSVKNVIQNKYFGRERVTGAPGKL
jgi:hypothetical protein